MHGIGVEIVPIGLRVIMIRDRANQHLVSYVINADQRIPQVLVKNSFVKNLKQLL